MATQSDPFPLAFMCHACGAISHNPNDAANNYCGRCRCPVRGSVFFSGQAAGAYPNGSRVRKVNSEPGDAHPDGSLGTVLSSISHPEVMGGMVAYFVAWDARPTMPIGTDAPKVELAP